VKTHCGLLVLSSALLAAPCAWPAPAAPKVAAPEAKAVAAARDRLKKVLEVSPATLDAAARYLADAELVKQAPTEAGLCSLVVSAGTLHVKLGDELSPARDKLYELPPAAPGQPDPIDAFSGRVDEADKLLPGIGLSSGAETLSHSVRYGELAQLARQGSAEQRLFQALSGIWREPAGWPVYVEQKTDVTGCWRPGALLEPLRGVAAVWGEAPQCLRQATAPALRDAMTQAVSATCFCEGQKETVQQLQQLEAAYEKLPVPGAQAAAAEARKVRQQGKGLKFNCH
jgi:hypothetical protein